jgi:hypothetical protein
MTFEFSFLTDFREQVRAQRAIYYHRHGWQLLRIIAVLLVVVGMYVLPIAFDRRRRLADEWVELLLLGFLMGVIGLAIYQRPYMSVKAGYGRNRPWPVPQTFALQERGLLVIGAVASSCVDWPGISEVRETSEFVLFFISDEAAFVLPKRVVKVMEWPGLREALRSWLGDRARLPS